MACGGPRTGDAARERALVDSARGLRGLWAAGISQFSRPWVVCGSRLCLCVVREPGSVFSPLPRCNAAPCPAGYHPIHPYLALGGGCLSRGRCGENPRVHRTAPSDGSGEPARAWSLAWGMVVADPCTPTAAASTRSPRYRRVAHSRLRRRARCSRWRSWATTACTRTTRTSATRTSRGAHALLGFPLPER